MCRCALLSVLIFVAAAPLRSQDEYLLGDFDQSGDLSISDAVLYFDWSFRRAEFPGCLAAIDVRGEGNFDISNGIYLLEYLFGGGPAPRETVGEELPCESYRVRPPERLGSIRLEVSDILIEGQENLQFDAFGEVAVRLHTPAHDVQAWSFALELHGCAPEFITERGTSAAEQRWGGLRDLGYYRMSYGVDSDGQQVIFCAAVLSMPNAVALEASDEPYDILRVHLTPDLWGDGAGAKISCPCWVGFFDSPGFADGGSEFTRPVRTEVTVDGRPVIPEQEGREIDLCLGPAPPRGDCNGDFTLDISDVIFAVEVLFLGGGEERFWRGDCDANSDGTHDISDPIYILNYLFQGGPAPEPWG
jgi:hypothetical protein